MGQVARQLHTTGIVPGPPSTPIQPPFTSYPFPAPSLSPLFLPLSPSSPSPSNLPSLSPSPFPGPQVPGRANSRRHLTPAPLPSHTPLLFPPYPPPLLLPPSPPSQTQQPRFPLSPFPHPPFLFPDPQVPASADSCWRLPPASPPSHTPQGPAMHQSQGALGKLPKVPSHHNSSYRCSGWQRWQQAGCRRGGRWQR